MGRITDFHQELTLLGADDLFILYDRPDADFGFPIHSHNDFELNLILGARGKRMVGDSCEFFNDPDIVLTGPSLPHKWSSDTPRGKRVITIRFPGSMADYPVINKRVFNQVSDMLLRAKRGVSFSVACSDEICNRVFKLMEDRDNPVLFLDLLYFLASTNGQRELAGINYQPEAMGRHSRSRRINAVSEYVNRNYPHNIKLSDVAALAHMSESAFCHFFKKRTGRKFNDFLNEVRIGHAARRLYETTETISEICYSCGFNNTSNFIRVFKKKRGKTPSEYRADTFKHTGN